MKRKSGTMYYNGGIIRPTRYGTFRVEINHVGQRFRTTCKTLGEARTTIDVEMAAMESNARPLTVLEIEEARRAFAELPPGVRLGDVVKHYMDRQGPVREVVPLDIAVERYVTAKEKRGLREKTIKTARYRLQRLVEAFPGAGVNDVTMLALLTLLEDLGVAGLTYNGYRSDWAAFFEWCCARDYAATNPARRIEKHLQDDEVAEFFPVAEARRWFGALEAHDPGLAPYFALSFFGGIRAAELHRMAGDLVDPDLIKVTPAHAKTRTMRHIAPCDTLKAWLETYPPAPGSLALTNHRPRVSAVRAKLDGFQWVNNGGRKSFATYHLELSQDAPRTAAILGHGNPNLLYSTYRGLTTRSESEAYFNILPGAKA